MKEIKCRDSGFKINLLLKYASFFGFHTICENEKSLSKFRTRYLTFYG